MSSVGFIHLNFNPGTHFTGRQNDLKADDFTGNLYWFSGSVSTAEQSLLFSFPNSVSTAEQSLLLSFPNEIGYCQDVLIWTVRFEVVLVRRLLVQEANSTSRSNDDEVTCKYGRKGLRFFLPLFFLLQKVVNLMNIMTIDLIFWASICSWL